MGKFALRDLAQSLARELSPQSINVVAFAARSPRLRGGTIMPLAVHIWSFQCHEWGKRFLHAGNAAAGIERRNGRGRGHDFVDDCGVAAAHTLAA
jgi:hypothetical protein